MQIGLYIPAWWASGTMSSGNVGPVGRHVLTWQGIELCQLRPIQKQNHALPQLSEAISESADGHPMDAFGAMEQY